MNLLIITRKIDNNDARAGFIYNWIKKFSQKVDKLIVICQERGDISGLENIKIYSLGKEYLGKRPNFIRRIIYGFRFYKYIWKLRKEYDAVFVHMHTIYIILGALFWKLWGKEIGLWYAHIRTSFLAKLASFFIEYIFSPSKDSFSFARHKLKETGHGIDTEIFKPLNLDKKKERDKRQIISVGRISLVKEYEVLIKAVEILVNQHQLDNFEIKIIGRPANPEDFDYFENLKKEIAKHRLESYFDWVGDVPNKDVFKFYQQADIFVNMQPGGGFVKAVLEAMACGLICILSTPVFNEILKESKTDTIFKPRNPNDMAEKMKRVLNWNPEQIDFYRKLIVNYVRNNHNLDNLVDKIVSVYER
jgi:glycosyltransferase involved in cell wall biosynthesis